MGFLREAYGRGVLRQQGGAYEFRSILLQELLAGVLVSDAAAVPGTSQLTAIGGTGPDFG